MPRFPINPVIPSKFTLIDDSVTAADEYANVHDIQKAHENHNILIAQRIKKPVVTMLCNTPANSTAYQHLSYHPVDTWDGPRFAQIPLWINKHTKSIEVVIRASKSSASAGAAGITPKVYYALRNPEMSEGPQEPLNTYSVSVTQAWSSVGAVTTYNTTVGVPLSYRSMPLINGRRFLMLDIYCQCQIDTAAWDTGPGIAINDVGTNWIDVAANTIGEREIVVIDSDTDFGVRKVVRRYTNGANSRLFLDLPYQTQPVPGTDTVGSRVLVGPLIWAISVYELPDTALRLD